MKGSVPLNRQLVCWAVVVIISIFAVYARVMSFGFVWDDSSVLWDSGSYRGDNFFSAIWANFPISENYFRPFVVATFAFDMLVFNNMPGPMHLHNLLVHICSSLLVAGLVVQYLQRFQNLNSLVFPVLAALIFGLHPMLMEPAAWISGRFDGYVTFWLLLLLNIDFIVSRQSYRIGSAFVLFLLAALSKEMAVTFPMLYILMRAALLKEQGSIFSRIKALRKDGSVIIFVTLLLAGVFYLALRFSALGYVQQPFDQGIVRAHFGSALQHTLLVGKTAGTYLMYSVAGGAYTSPVHYQVFPVSYTDKGAWCGLLLTIFLSVISFVMVRKGNRLGYVWLVFVCGLLPVLNILFWPNTEDIVQERFMSLPMALLVALLMVELAEVPAEKKKLTLLIVSGFLLVNTAITAASMPVWRDHMSLWSWAAYRAPLSPYATTNLAVSYRINNDQVNAKKYAEIANKLDPLLLMGDFTLASIAADQKNYLEAIRIADGHMQRDGLTENQRGDFLYIKANALHQLGRSEDAIKILEGLVRNSEENRQSAMLLGTILNAGGQKERASACWAMALKSMPASEAKKKFSDGEVHIDALLQMAGGADCVLTIERKAGG